VGEIVVQQIVVEEVVVISQPIALERQYMPYPELLAPPGTQGQKIEPRSGKQGPCLEEGPVLGPISGGLFWGQDPQPQDHGLFHWTVKDAQRMKRNFFRRVARFLCFTGQGMVDYFVT
jgi:hypothetical protein